MGAEQRSVFKIDNCVCCCNLYMAVISVVNVCFFLRKHKNKRGMSPKCLIFFFLVLEII